MSAQALPLRDHLQRLVWLCLLPSVLVIVLLAAFAVERLHVERVDELDDTATKLALAIDAELQRRIHGLQALGAGAPVPLDEQAYARWHRRLRAYDEAFNTPVMLVDSSRHMLLHSREPLGTALPVVPKPKGRLALEAALESGKPIVSDVLTGPVLKQLIVSIIVPLAHEPGLFATMAVVPVKEVLQRFHAVPLPEGWRVSLIDSAGDVIAPQGTDRPAQASSDGGRHISKTLQSVPWTLHVDVDFWAFYKSRVAIAALLLAGLVATVGGTAWAARRAAEGLNASIARLGRGLQPADGASLSTLGKGEVAVAEIEAAREEMLRLKAAQLTAQEHERRRIARELHDGLQQDLGALRMHVGLMNGPTPPSPQALQELAEKSQTLAQTAIDELERIVNDLRPWTLEILGPMAALEKLVDEFREVCELQIELETVGDSALLESLPEPVVTAIYRVTQECLNNVRKHAHASFVHIIVDISEPGKLTLQISDDGVGISSSESGEPQTLGLRSMAERVSALGGSLHISRGHADDPSHGTTVMATVPIAG